MGVTCQIITYKTNSGVFYSGQPVRGKVKYVISEAKKYEAIVLSLLGTGKCKFTLSSSDNDSTYHASEEYITRHVNVLPYAAVLQPGSYEHEYQFKLPDDVPSSFKSPNCTIRYQIQMRFEKINSFSFTTSKKFKTDIPVYQLFEVSEGPVMFGLDKTLLKLFSRKEHYIKLTAEVGRTCFSPGENVSLSILLKNDTDERPTVKASLRCYTTFTAKKIQSRVIEKVKDCDAISPGMNVRTVTKFHLSIPTRGELYTINSNIMKKEYKLRVKVILPSPHRNAVVEMPVTIGEEKGDRGTTEVRDMYWEAMMEDAEE